MGSLVGIRVGGLTGSLVGTANASEMSASVVRLGSVHTDCSGTERTIAELAAPVLSLVITASKAVSVAEIGMNTNNVPSKAINRCKNFLVGRIFPWIAYCSP